MRAAMTCESLVVKAQARSTRRVSARNSLLRAGLSRMSLPQAEPTMRARRRQPRCAAQASVPCEVR